MILALSLISLALAADPADPTIVVPGGGTVTQPPAPPVSHIETIRTPSEAVDATTAAIVLWCQPDKTAALGGKMGYMDLGFEAESKAMIAALSARSDIGSLVFMNNPTSSEIATWLTQQQSVLNGDTYREVLVTIACPATGGDTDEERLFTREVTSQDAGGLAFSDLATGIGKISASSVWLIDASRDVTAAMEPGSTSYGPTADDPPRYSTPDALAISTGGSGRYAKGGLIAAAANVIAASKGTSLTLETFYYRGIKPAVPELDLATSMGIASGDAWNQNGGRMVFVGGPLIAPQIAALPPAATPPKRKAPTGCWVAGAGVLGLIGTSIVGVSANADYEWLSEVNAGTRTTNNTELNATVNRYKMETGVAIGLGALSTLALVGGTTWTVLDVEGRKHSTTVTLTPTGAGAALTITH